MMTPPPDPPSPDAPSPDDERRNRALRQINAHIGRRARERRAARQLSQDDVAQLIGMSYQQVQKYENGDSAIAAARMVQLALALRTDPRDFLVGLSREVYEGLGFVAPAGAPAPQQPTARQHPTAPQHPNAWGHAGLAEEQAALGPRPAEPGAAPVPLAELAALRDAFLAIRDEEKRRIVLSMARALSEG